MSMSPPQSTSRRPRAYEVFISNTALNPETFLAELPLPSQGSSSVSYAPDPPPADGRARFFFVRSITPQGGRSAFSVVSSLPPFGVYAEPIDQAVLLDGQVDFRVNAIGRQLSYQWLRDDAPISGQNSSSLRVQAVPENDQARYSCQVSDTNNGQTVTYTTRAAELRALDLPREFRGTRNQGGGILLEWTPPARWEPTIPSGAGVGGVAAGSVRCLTATIHGSVRGIRVAA